MAVLIGKVVRSGGTSRRDGLQESASEKTNPHHHRAAGNTTVVMTSSVGGNSPMKPPPSPLEGDLEARGSSSGSQAPLSGAADQQGIMKTVETMILVDERADHELREGKRQSRTLFFDGDM